MFGWLRRRRELGLRASRLYGGLVELARAPGLYETFGIPDSLDGRFDSVVLHAHLVMRRLGELGPGGRRLSQRLFDLMFADMDQTLRELGVGDLSVGKKIRQMVEAFYGRVAAYERALAAGAAGEMLEAALQRNIYRGAAPQPAQVAGLAAYVRGMELALRGVELAAFESGAWPAPPRAAEAAA